MPSVKELVELQNKICDGYCESSRDYDYDDLPELLMFLDKNNQDLFNAAITLRHTLDKFKVKNSAFEWSDSTMDMLFGVLWPDLKDSAIDFVKAQRLHRCGKTGDGNTL